jgi:hypothetical protein
LALGKEGEEYSLDCVQLKIGLALAQELTGLLQIT